MSAYPIDDFTPGAARILTLPLLLPPPPSLSFFLFLRFHLRLVGSIERLNGE